jgi:hypothetical protein
LDPSDKRKKIQHSVIRPCFFKTWLFSTNWAKGAENQKIIFLKFTGLGIHKQKIREIDLKIHEIKLRVIKDNDLIPTNLLIMPTLNR